MKKSFKLFVSLMFFYGVFCFFSSISLTMFKTYWDDKIVYLSSSTCKFLKTVIPEFEKWLCRLKQSSNPSEGSLAYYRIQILEILRCFRNADKACGKDIEKFGTLLAQAQVALISEIKTIDFGVINKHLHKLIKEIGRDLSIAVRQVYIGTAKEDLKVIDNYVKNPNKEYTLTVYGLIQDIVKHFDGLAVTEYDFVVLSSCALFVLFSIE